MNDLRCPACYYDLRGLVIARRWVRCPECGRRTDIDTLAADLVTRRRKTRAFGIDLSVMIGLALMILIIGANYDGFTGANALRMRLWFIASGPGVLLAALLTIGLYLLSIPPWYDLRRGDRIAFAIGATFLLLIVPTPWGVLFLVAWLGAFHLWAMRLAMRVG